MACDLPTVCFCDPVIMASHDWWYDRAISALWNDSTFGTMGLYLLTRNVFDILTCFWNVCFWHGRRPWTSFCCYDNLIGPLCSIHSQCTVCRAQYVGPVFNKAAQCWVSFRFSDERDLQIALKLKTGGVSPLCSVAVRLVLSWRQTSCSFLIVSCMTSLCALQGPVVRSPTGLIPRIKPRKL